MLVNLNEQELFQKNMEAYNFKNPNEKIKTWSKQDQIERLNWAEMMMWKDVNIDVKIDQTDHFWLKCPLCQKEMIVTKHFYNEDNSIFYIFGKCYYYIVKGMRKINFLV